jgi:2-oxoglutarate dehydrogenase E2 component (dihydrolipoamide succinyltransferase)
MFGFGMAINQMGGTGSLISPIGGGEAPAAPADPATPAAPAPAPEAPAAPATEEPAAPAVDTSNMSDDDIAAMRAAGIDPTAQ